MPPLSNLNANKQYGLGSKTNLHLQGKLQFLSLKDTCLAVLIKGTVVKSVEN